MDRQIVYPGQILPETSLLQMAKDAMIGSAKLAAAVLGTSTVANGFAVTPTGPASLQVVCAPGEIYSLTAIDALAFSTLPADTTHSIMKQGILLDGVTLSCPAPGTTGQSINYLIQVTYQDSDATPVLLPYYNSANPALPYSGMGNNGLTQNTVRKGIAVVAVKAGASAATGSQTTPAPDAGYVGLYVVTVAYGQTTITSSSIAQYASAPLLPSGLLQSIQNGNTSFAIDTGTANTYVCNFTPAITARNEGQVVRFKAKFANNGACTLNDGFGPVALVGGAHNALQGGEIVANGDGWAQWNTSIGGGSYILLFCTGAAEQVSPATQSMHAVQKAQLGNFNNLIFASINTTWTATSLGQVIVVLAAGTTQTLPAVASAPSGTTMTFSAYGATTLKANASETIANIYGTLFTNTIQIGAGEQVQLTSNSTGWYISSYAGANAAAPIGTAANAKMSITAASASATFTADEVVVGTSLGGQTYRLISYSKAINLATTGAGGMDTGTAPVSGFVALYAIYNPSTGASSILAANATSAVMASVYGGANMPTGYTASALLAVVPTNGSSQFKTMQVRGRSVSIGLVTVLSSTVNVALSALSVASAVPMNAIEVSGELGLSSSSASNLSVNIQADAQGCGQQNLSQALAAGGSAIGNFSGVLLGSPQTAYTLAQTSGAGPTFNIYIGRYSI
ncbi:hypothetical protein [Pseudomonas fluorescens]|uniref:hypothetical protein n=1 Tax=Pseudomonas fluorescens TaxID=294 RepID=UPI003D238031